MRKPLNITTIYNQVQTALLDSKIYKDEKEFFEIDQKKILISVLKDRLGISYAKLGKELNLSWFPVYKSCLIARSKYKSILDKVMKVVK